MNLFLPNNIFSNLLVKSLPKDKNLKKNYFPAAILTFELSKDKSDAYTFDRPPKCAECNRVRLTSDGYLKPCLHSNKEIILNAEDLAGSLKEAVLAKPERGRACTNRSMIEIGG